ncbi:MAG: histidine phosphatase family protein [Thiotrichales bacterium]
MLHASWRYFRLALALMFLTGGSTTLRADEMLWDALRRGTAVALIRHAEAPGFGDPPGFTLSDCATQRNLSEAGRTQARAIGAAFQKQGIGQAQVLSSRWCRCLETARLLQLGPVTPLPSLDSFFTAPERGPPQTAQLRADLTTSASPEGPRVLVTHQVNITGLTGVSPRAGEVIVVKVPTDGEVTVLGRLDPSSARE